MGSERPLPRNQKMDGIAYRFRYRVRCPFLYSSELQADNWFCFWSRKGHYDGVPAKFDFGGGGLVLVLEL